jgi:hypothetical protein
MEGKVKLPPDPVGRQTEVEMQIEDFSFGSIRIDGTTHEDDVVIAGGEIRKRKKKPSKKFGDDFAHTPLSVEEDIPWKCRRPVIGTGAYEKLPMMPEVKREAERRTSNCSSSPRKPPLKNCGGIRKAQMQSST